MKILISAANADVCQSIGRIIRSHEQYKDCQLIGLTPDDPWPALRYFDEVINVPMAYDPDYGGQLAKVLAAVSPDIFLPFSEAELSWFLQNQYFSLPAGTKVIINSYKVLENFLDKKKTVEFLSGVGVGVPKTYNFSDVRASDLPVIIKPCRSAGSKNMAIIRNMTQLHGFIEEQGVNIDQFIIQELIDQPDAEYTCGMWRFDNALRYCVLRRRLQGGMTGFAIVEDHPAINKTLEKVADSIQGNLHINVQLRVRDNLPYIFEINPRFSSTVMMRHKLGFQDFIWTLDWFLKNRQPPSWRPTVGTKVYRVSEECVVQSNREVL